MKRTISLFIAVVVIVAFAAPSFAGDAVEKFKGGAKDVIMSPLEVRDHVKAETDGYKFMPIALTGGLLKGGFYMAKKIVTGSLDIVTSPLELVKK